jgi:DNA ligase D-like protein (predicted 3'-phosphoesterase)
MKEVPLQSYREKRDFSLTSEPRGEMPEDDRSADERIFVVQKHAARNLHYDFRLEVDGVLKSWAVPKGPSMDPKQKHLAIAVEDHPLDYASFEGRVPAGQYGAGTVIVWDTGTYRNLTELDGQIVPVSRALENGHISVWLDGKKLKGGFSLTRTSRGWIMVKMRDEEANSSTDILKAEPASVLSGRTIEEMEKMGNEIG